jgi:hypothetical protein
MRGHVVRVLVREVDVLRAGRHVGGAGL